MSRATPPPDLMDIRRVFRRSKAILFVHLLLTRRGIDDNCESTSEYCDAADNFEVALEKVVDNVAKSIANPVSGHGKGEVRVYHDISTESESSGRPKRYEGGLRRTSQVIRTPSGSTIKVKGPHPSAPIKKPLTEATVPGILRSGRVRNLSSFVGGVSPNSLKKKEKKEQGNETGEGETEKRKVKSTKKERRS